MTPRAPSGVADAGRQFEISWQETARLRRRLTTSARAGFSLGSPVRRLRRRRWPCCSWPGLPPIMEASLETRRDPALSVNDPLAAVPRRSTQALTD